MNPQMMAQLLRSGGQQQQIDPQALIGLYQQYMQADPQQAALQAGIAPVQQPINMQSGGFRNPQMPQGGMGTMQGMPPIQQGIIR